MLKRKQFDPESFDGKIIKCSSFANLNTLNLVLCQKLNLGETYYHQTVKLGTQSKRYEQNYSQMILPIQIKYIRFTFNSYGKPK